MPVPAMGTQRGQGFCSRFAREQMWDYIFKYVTQTHLIKLHYLGKKTCTRSASNECLRTGCATGKVSARAHASQVCACRAGWCVGQLTLSYVSGRSLRQSVASGLLSASFPPRRRPPAGRKDPHGSILVERVRLHETTIFLKPRIGFFDLLGGLRVVRIHECLHFANNLNHSSLNGGPSGSFRLEYTGLRNILPILTIQAAPCS